MNLKRPLIAIVGPCAAGKTTLAAFLEKCGFQVRQIAQEHSYVPDMWRLITNPDFLIFLDVSYQVSIHRTGNTWKETIFHKQTQRLLHAKEHADLYLHTDSMTPHEVQEQVIKVLQPLYPLPAERD